MAEETKPEIIGRYFIQLSYKGTRYHGWQIQENANSVQAELNQKLSLMLGETVETTGAGRTDTGVHALYYIAHFDSANLERVAALFTLKNPWAMDAYQVFVQKLNGFLSPDIAVQQIFKMHPNAHARFDALSRTYEYHISRFKNPFLNDYAYYLRGKLDVELMNRMARELFSYEDFKSFSKTDSGNHTSLCTISRAEWEEKDDLLVFTIKANRFLRNMVRAIVGTLLDAGTGKINRADFKNIIEGKDRRLAGTSVPAKGLFLTFIEYPPKFNLFPLSSNKNQLAEP